MSISLALLISDWQTVQHIGDLTSILGLGVSLVVLVVSQKARNAALEAAGEARRTLSRKFLASDLRGCSEDLELITTLWDGSWRQKAARELSHRLAHRLHGRLRQLSMHPWKPNFDKETEPALQQIVRECGKLVIELRKSLFTSSVEKQASMVPDAINDLNGLIQTEIGRYQFD
jgi:hypothetical protein